MRAIRELAALLSIALLLSVVQVDAGGPAPGRAALALDCPAGWQVRGLNCCRVRGGQVQCQRNVRLPDALAPLVHDPSALARPVPVGNGDLEDPALGPRPITTDSRLLDPADDTCGSAACDFDLIRSIAALHRQAGTEQCLAALGAHYCRHSPWTALDLDQRFARLLVLGQPFAEAAGIDARALPCIAAIETRTLEPLAVSEYNCLSGWTSDQGLPQIIRPTFDALRERAGFTSTVVDDDDGADGARLFAEIARSVRHQLELMVAVLVESGAPGPDGGRGLDAFIRYNGSFRSIAYGQAVDTCLACMRDRVDLDRFEMRGDPIRCLGAAYAGPAIRDRFAETQAQCQAIDTPATPAMPGDLPLSVQE